jgi:hypothetical protein
MCVGGVIFLSEGSWWYGAFGLAVPILLLWYLDLGLQVNPDRLISRSPLTKRYFLFKDIESVSSADLETKSYGVTVAVAHSAAVNVVLKNGKKCQFQVRAGALALMSCLEFAMHRWRQNSRF